MKWLILRDNIGLNSKVYIRCQIGVNITWLFLLLEFCIVSCGQSYLYTLDI